MTSILAAGICWPQPAASTDEIAANSQSTSLPGNDSDILAFVGQQAITRQDVDFILGRSGRPDLPQLSFAAQQAAIQLVATQKQALQSLRAQKLAADRQQVENWIQNSTPSPTTAQAAEIVSQLAQENSVSEAIVWELMAFRLSWKSYLAKHLNQANIARHFSNQKARFDGTRFRVQLLSVAVPAGQSSQRDSAGRDLTAVRNRLVTLADQSAAFMQAADEHDWQLSEEMWIEGSGSLDPQAVDALLKLAEGEVSPPVHTASGVHLIRLLEKQPGELELEQVKDEVRAHLLVFLLQYLASLSHEQLPLKAAE